MTSTGIFTTGSKLFFGIAAAALAGLVVWGVGADWDPLGNVAFIGLAAASGFLGGTIIAFRDAGATAVAGAPVTAASGGPAASPIPWPLVAAFAVAVAVLGLVTEPLVLIGGLVLLGISVLEWMVAAWADDLSSDPAYNRSVRNRVMYPIEVPVAAVLVAAVVIIGFSRLLLAMPKTGSTTVFGILGAIVFFIGIMVSLRPRISANVVSVLLVVGGIGILAAGVTGAAVGEREISAHPEEWERTATVADMAAADAVIVLKDGEFDLTRIEIPRATTVTFIFQNEDEAEANLHLLVDGDPATPLRTGPVAQSLTFRIDIPGEYEFVNDADPENDRGTIVVIGTPPSVTTTTTAASSN
ncbi:MAG: cupredoxin domain-containing protein [Acidimicrobiales bacterium]|nr:cupredoxin domain-containing protein [Acidimicrobiales bacterium]